MNIDTDQFVIYLEEVIPNFGIDTRVYITFNQSPFRYTLYITRRDKSHDTNTKNKFRDYTMSFSSYATVLTFLKECFDVRALVNYRMYGLNVMKLKNNDFRSYSSAVKIQDEIFGYDNKKMNWKCVKHLLIMLRDIT
jgi:hypothetical protein